MTSQFTPLERHELRELELPRDAAPGEVGVAARLGQAAAALTRGEPADERGIAAAFRRLQTVDRNLAGRQIGAERRRELLRPARISSSLMLTEGGYAPRVIHPAIADGLQQIAGEDEEPAEILEKIRSLKRWEGPTEDIGGDEWRQGFGQFSERLVELGDNAKRSAYLFSLATNVDGMFGTLDTGSNLVREPPCAGPGGTVMVRGAAEIPFDDAIVKLSPQRWTERWPLVFSQVEHVGRSHFDSDGALTTEAIPQPGVTWDGLVYEEVGFGLFRNVLYIKQVVSGSQMTTKYALDTSLAGDLTLDNGIQIVRTTVDPNVVSVEVSKELAWKPGKLPLQFVGAAYCSQIASWLSGAFPLE